MVEKCAEVGKNSMTYCVDIGIGIEQVGGLCFHCRKRTSIGVRKQLDCSTVSATGYVD